MTSFFGRLKSGNGPASPASSTPPAKKDPNAPQLTPLEKLLLDAGPIRPDGSDKFFGFENFGSTCYCNSIVQCLYYSVPFREQVINFPSRSPPEALERPASGPLPRLNTNLLPDGNAQNSTLSPKGGRNSFSTPNTASPRKPVITPGGAVNPQGQKPEDNKDSPEYKKKQALAAGPVLNMDYENSKAYGMSESLFSALKDIFEAVIAHRSHIGVVSPQKFLEILRRENEMFRTPMHQDAHEFLNLLLNEVVENVEHFAKSRVHEIGNGDANSVVPHSNGGLDLTTTQSGSTGWVHDLFEGTLTSETRCLTCENTSQRDEAFLDLSVDLEQHSSVTSCLRKFSEEEMLCERNKFHCDNCGGLQEAEKRMKIKRLPRILALHLKRFKYTEDLQRLQKLFHRVVYPYYLRLFNTTDDAEDPDRLYELYAVVVHIGGGPYHGHYVSIIKTQDRGWLLFDDEMVEPVDKAYVRRFFGGEDQLACAYVLFYQETTEEAMMKEQEEESLAAAKQAAEVNAEPISVTTPKANGHHGFLNGHAMATTPTMEKDDQFASLDHAATAPPIPTSEHSHHNHTLEHIATSIPKLSKRQSNLQSKKEKAKEEKERKAHEKELEKQAKAKRKEAEHQRRDMYRRQEDELRQALAASRATATEESKRRVNDAHGTPDGHMHALSNQHTPEHHADAHEKEKEKEKDKENQNTPTSAHTHNGFSSLGKSTGLSRFRHSSMSLRHKPKFWPGGGGSSSSKDDHHHKKETQDEQPPMPSTPGWVEKERESGGSGGEGEGAAEGGKEQKEGKRHRFSLGRKKSTFHL